ncbi:MAG: hypothetical protein MPW15_24540 [Candidatus Manganitrophus sp.]|nr:hypothetical protein [Candidatus Manganitrophus sp.]
MVSETIDDVPFDLRALRVIEYNKNEPNWGDLLEEKITSSVKEILKSPLESVLPAFINVKAKPQATITPHEKEVLELKQDLELLKREIRVSREYRPRSSLIRGPGEARVFLREMIRNGLSNRQIRELASRRGIPIPFADDELKSLRRERQLDLSAAQSEVKSEESAS